MKRSIEGFNGDNQEESKEKLKQKKLLIELLELQKVSTFLDFFMFLLNPN